MTFQIDQNEKDALRYACAMMNLHYSLMTGAICSAVVKHRNGDDITNTEAYYLARFILEKMGLDKAQAEYERLLTPEKEKLNNVLVTVERIEDLP